MQVPGLLLITLSILSFILLLIVVLVATIIVKNWLRMRHYERIQPLKSHVILNTSKNENESSFQDETIIPLLYPSAVQSYQFRPRASPVDRSVYDSVSSRASSYRSRVTVSTFDKRSTPFSHTLVNGAKCSDDRIMRSSSQISRSTEDIKYAESPQTGSHAGSEISHDSNRDFYETSHDTPMSVIDKLSFHSLDNTDLYQSNIYTHSMLLQEGAVESTLVVDPVVSYDQELSTAENKSSLGSLHFVLQYRACEPELLITIKQAKNLPSVTGTKDALVNSYVNLCIVPEDFLWKRTKVIRNERHPLYDETFQIKDVLYHKLREYTICFFVMDCHPVMGERPIGKVLYPLSDLRSEQTVTISKELIAP